MVTKEMELFVLGGRMGFGAGLDAGIGKSVKTGVDVVMETLVMAWDSAVVDAD